MALPLSYNLRNLTVRRTASAMAAAGIACVVAVFVCVMALAEGFRSAVATTGSPRNALVRRDGANSEIESAVDREASDRVKNLPEVARDAQDRPLCSADLVIVVNHPKRADGQPTNVTVRGVSGRPFEVRDQVRVVEGARFAPGSSEVIVGKALSGRIRDCQVGGSIRQAGQVWTVTGVFEAGGSAFESEIWGDAEVMMEAFKRPVFQSVTVRLRDPGGLEGLEKAFAEDKQLKSLKVDREDRYYAAQSQLLTAVIRTLGIVITLVMSIGAVIGATNTMYAQVAHRTKEIGTLLAIGFTPGSIFLAFLVESLLLSLAGGALGCLLALPVDGIATGTTNWTTFSEIAFQFRITPALLAWGIGFGSAMGVAGGALPAWRAATLEVTAALRRT